MSTAEYHQHNRQNHSDDMVTKRGKTKKVRGEKLSHRSGKPPTGMSPESVSDQATQGDVASKSSAEKDRQRVTKQVRAEKGRKWHHVLMAMSSVRRRSEKLRNSTH